MASPKRDAMRPDSGKLRAADDSIYDLTAALIEMRANLAALVGGGASGALPIVDSRLIPGLASEITDYPAASNKGRQFWALDTGLVYVSTGSTWLLLSSVFAASTVSPQATFTRPDNATPYTAGDVVGTDAATNMTFANMVTTAGGRFMVTGATLEIDVAAVPAGMTTFKVHLYNAAPTAIADNAAWALADADRAKYLGWFTLSAPRDVGGTLWSQNDNLTFCGKCAPSSTTVYGMIETDGAYTPSAQAVKVLTLYPMVV